ncbi:FixH family protein [Sphingomonas sp. LB-2]|uniref:FixH family protein n=1 Tax=Sphingomonas caeni TaxID=2984949 RepID=UPI00222E1F8E|nr:FixH family protein [Sphingomonas caeni]MCW3849499.1 FixH family protein [Sphingomonas caeni]
MTRQFTGRHMTAIMVAFFAVVIGVNVVMARSAIGTFGGVVVDNSYVASQKFNTWLRDADAQDRLGWRARASAEPGDRLVVTLAGPREPVTRATVTVEAEHPVGRLKSQQLTLTEERPGVYTAPHALPRGRWRLHIEARAAAGSARFIQDIRL